MLRRVSQVAISVTLGCIMAPSVWAVNLLEVYQQAIENNYSIRSDYNTYRSTAMSEKVNLGTLFPNFSVTGTASTNNIDNLSGNGNYQSIGYQLNLTQVLFDYGLYKTYTASKKTTLQSLAAYRYSKQQLMLNVSQAYFNILLAKDQLEYADANVKALKSALDQATVKFKVGVSTDTDVKQAEASYYNGVAELVSAQNDLDTSYYSLYQLTGKLEKNLAPLKSDIVYKEPSPNNIDYWVKTAKVYNQNYLSQKYQEYAAYDTMQSSYGAFLPSVSLVAQYSNTFNSGNENAYVNAAGLYNHQSTGYVGLSLTWNLFNGGTDYATQVQNARLYTAQEFTSLDSLRTLIQNTRSDYLNIQAYISQVAALEQSVKASDLAYKQFVEQYNVGTATITDVLDQLQSLFQAKSNLAEAKYNYFNGILQLGLDAGTLSIKDIQAINSQLQNS
ncbi:TolC family outer membrane protein [Thiotrichales bacterium 19S3-7]|nr:TolC family outer membrane protein [Thiotrichales bacterium 19S3-7]MCF6801247.1 TolC family outer membrane protein [Thiotrichales bacterium 19S3-11]